MRTLHEVMNWAMLHNMFGVDYSGPKSSPKLNKYGDITKAHSNCRYCRKKCKYFSKNKCFNKSIDEQLKCEFYYNI